MHDAEIIVGHWVIIHPPRWVHIKIVQFRSIDVLSEIRKDQTLLWILGWILSLKAKNAYYFFYLTIAEWGLFWPRKTLTTHNFFIGWAPFSIF